MMQRMKVVLLAGALELSDAIVYTLSLGRGLIGRGHEVRLIAADGPLTGLLDTDPLTHVAHALTSSRWRDVFERQRLREALADFNPEILHVVDESLDGAGAHLARRWQVPHAVTHHGRVAAPESWRRADVVIVPAQGQRATVVNQGKVAAERVRVVPYGLPDTPEPPLAPLADDHRPSIGTVGPLPRGRGLKQFAHAMCQVGKARPDALFPVIGSGPYHPFLIRHAEGLGIGDRLIVAESCIEPKAALGSLDIVVLPSVEEEFGYLAALAMALGRPIVASAVGQAFDLIEDGVTGILVPPGDERALSDAVLGLLHEPERARALGIAARTATRAGHSLEAMVSGTLDAYESLLAGVATTDVPAR